MIWRKRKSTAAACQQDLRHIGEEVSERYEYIPAQMLVIEDACQKYACACTVRTATKPAQPIEKSTAGARLLAHVIVSKVADHLPVHRQAKMCGASVWRSRIRPCAGGCGKARNCWRRCMRRLKTVRAGSKVVGTDDTPVKVLDRTVAADAKGPDVAICRRS